MSSEDDKQSVQESVQSEYDEIADEAIETLNRSGDFAGTEVEPPSKMKARLKPLWHRPWFAAAAVLLVGNLVYYFVAGDIGSDPVSSQSADEQAEKFLSTAPEVAGMLNEVSLKAQRKGGAAPHELQEAVQEIIAGAEGAGNDLKTSPVPCAEGICYDVEVSPSSR